MHNSQLIHKLWHEAEGIVILAGAGMSVDSGLPDFRGKQGMWTQAQSDFISLASEKGFSQDPVLVWNFYIKRMIAYAHTAPHAGYELLLKQLTQDKKPHFVVTSNVDGHFQKAGYPSDLIHEIHGSLAHAQCARMCTSDVVTMPQFTCELTHPDQVPTCANCGSMLRPNVMMFSDSHLVWRMIDRGAQAYRAWSAPKLNVLGIELGAGTQIPSIRLFGEERTCVLIRVNLYESHVNRAQDVSLPQTALEGIKHIISCVR
jgi:NAD-dependent SIR2 family protein deacetylase